jgi:hypothetical protein
VDDRYYYGLNPVGLAHNEYWLIVIIQAASFCESRHVDYIRYSLLKTISDEVLRTINKRRFGLGGGSFKSIIKTCSNKGFLRIEKVSKKETRIYPNIPLIKREVEAKKIENLACGNKRIIRIVPNDATVQHHPRLVPESILVSDSVARQTTKVRAPPTESVKVSDTLSAVVTHPNQGKQKKRKQSSK